MNSEHHRGQQFSASVFKHGINLPDNEATTAGLTMISRSFIDIILILGFVGAQEDYTHLLRGTSLAIFRLYSPTTFLQAPEEGSVILTSGILAFSRDITSYPKVSIFACGT